MTGPHCLQNGGDSMTNTRSQDDDCQTTGELCSNSKMMEREKYALSRSTDTQKDGLG